MNHIFDCPRRSMLPLLALVFAFGLGLEAYAQEACAPCPPSRAQRAQTVQPAAPRVDWTTLPSTYTHSDDGQRVDQYAKAVEPEAYGRADFVRSGYTHSRSSLQVGFNSDHYHVTEQWGPQVRPYGEWRSPYRPYSTPYGAWGPQLPQVVGGGWGLGAWGMLGNGPIGNGMWPGMGQGPPHPGHPGGGPMPPMGGGAAGAGGPVGGAGMGGAPGAGIPPGMGMHPGHHPGMHPGMGMQSSAPWWGYPGVTPYAPYGGVGAFGVGPGNAMAPLQDDYYPQAPVYQQPNEGYFHSPYRNIP